MITLMVSFLYDQDNVEKYTNLHLSDPTVPQLSIKSTTNYRITLGNLFRILNSMFIKIQREA